MARVRRAAEGGPAGRTVAHGSAAREPSREPARDLTRERPEPGTEPEHEPAQAPGHEPGPGPGLSRRARLAEAVWDRLPLWVRTRCGVEPRALAALGLVLVVALGFAAHHFWTGRPQTVGVPSVESAPDPRPDSSPPRPSARPPAPAPDVRHLLVDVAGKVRKPGVHRLPAGARVADALRAAGGVRPGTDLEGLNRARPVVDGEQIVVGEPAAAIAAPAPPAAGGPPTGVPISLNSATVEQLDALPGIGPVMARRIVDYRTEHGGFTSVEQLRDIDGIGERRFADLRPLVGP